MTDGADRLPRWRGRRVLPVLKPRAGRRLPAELRAENIHRVVGETCPGGLADPSFLPLLATIDDQAPIHEGNRVEIYVRGEPAFAAMVEAIDSAREEVLVESYILRDDATGRAVLETLAAAAGRGVTVRVLADAVGSVDTRRAFWQSMRRRGIAVRLFHPILPALHTFLFRDHRKILVVDRRIAFTGGMNIGEEYGSVRGSGLVRPAGPAEGGRDGGDGADTPEDRKAAWRDTHLRVEGSSAWEMALVFAEGWSRAGGEPFAIDSPEAQGVAEAAAGGEANGGGARARVLVLDSRPHRGHDESASVLAALVAGARERLWITNGYFAPRPRVLPILGRAVERGVDVRLLLPGVTDVPLVRHAGHGVYRRLLELGVRIWEYQPAILHAKSLLADDRVTVVGSTNLDFRSFHYNAECNLVVFDRSAARRLEEVFLADLDDSVEIEAATWRRRGLAHRWGDRLARLLSPLL